MTEHPPPRGAPNPREGRAYSVTGAVCGILALVTLPIVFGPAGIVLGYVARAKGDRRFGLVVAVGSLVIMVVAFALNARYVAGGGA